LKKFMETRNASAAPPTSHRVSKRSAGAPSSSKSIEQLRQERLERELAERKIHLMETFLIPTIPQKDFTILNLILI
jgi:hypothetical protein